MSTLTNIVLVCDRCGVENEPTQLLEVRTYTVKVDRTERTFEACNECIPIPVIDELLEKGRKT